MTERIDRPATPRQLVYLEAMAREAGYSQDCLTAFVGERWGVTTEHLTRRQASEAIERMSQIRVEREMDL